MTTSTTYGYNTEKMTIQEIFTSPAVREIELQIILLLRKSEKNGRSGDADSIALTHLLKVRKNSMFIMNDEYNALLSEFNDALTEQLLEMRKQTIQMRDAILNINIEGNEIEAVGKCFLGYEYPRTILFKHIELKQYGLTGK